MDITSHIDSQVNTITTHLSAVRSFISNLPPLCVSLLSSTGSSAGTTTDVPSSTSFDTTSGTPFPPSFTISSTVSPASGSTGMTGASHSTGASAGSAYSTGGVPGGPM
eukprot:10144153-Ditylum_brightwellii.AAC.1